MLRVCICIVNSLTFGLTCFAHSGGTDASGGHTDHSTGLYHHHNGGFGGVGIPFLFPEAAIVNRQAIASARLLSLKTRGARLKAKKEARSSARTPVVYSQVEPTYLFHHTKLAPYEVGTFRDDGRFWKTQISKGITVNLPKETIVRIEPISDPKNYRTWFDLSGEYSLVGKYVAYDAPHLKLEDTKGLACSIEAVQLSEFDQKHLYYKILKRDPPTR